MEEQDGKIPKPEPGETESIAEKMFPDDIEPGEESDGEEVPGEEKKKKKGKKEKDAGRGIETMFRTSLRNHISLSQIADGKANIMLSVNSIILSVVISFLFPRFKEDPTLVLPSGVLILVCVAALTFAIISTIPKVTRGRVTKEEIENKTANLLFFGNFHDMPLDDFQYGVNQMLKDKDFLYGAMIRDFYNLGKVLSVKYKYLRISYIVFMYGLIFSVLTFAAAYAFKITL